MVFSHRAGKMEYILSGCSFSLREGHELGLISEIKKVWALPVSLATTPGIVVYFLFLGVLRCFSSPGYRYPVLYIQTGANRHYST